MAQPVSARDFRNDNAGYLRRVAAGESFLVTSNGIPVAEVRPATRRLFIPAEELIEAFRTLPPIDAAALRSDLALLEDGGYEARA